MAKLGYGQGTAAVLALVAGGEGASALQVQQALGMPEGAARTLLSRLVGRGLLRAFKVAGNKHANTRHGGVKVYAITDAGRAELAEPTPRTRTKADEDDTEIPWPTWDYDAIVAAAVATQPTCVWDLAR